jgi:phosphatidylglycerol:prolipoprotein diacylglycerol transferase
MYRYLLKLGPLTIYSYGAMLALAFIAGTFFAAFRARKQAIDPNRIIDLSLVIVLTSIIGARLLFVALNLRFYKNNPLDIFKVWEGGLVFYGGFILAFVSVVYFLKKNKLAVWKVADIFSAPLALGMAIGRIGCFLNGCCYGKISQRFGVCFPAKDNPPAFTQQVFEGMIPQSAGCSLPVFPTQLYESGACLLIFLAILALERKKHFDGFSFWLFVLLYSLFRFIIEGFRYYDANFISGPITVSQAVSIILFVISLIALETGFTIARKGK